MKILNICSEDHANYMYSNMLAIRSVGLQCDSYKLHKHPFKYDNEAIITTEEKMFELCSDYDIVQIFHTYVPQFLKDIRSRIFVYHTGTIYRQGIKHYNNLFNKYAERTFVDIPDLFNRDAVNCTLFPGSVEQNELELSNNIYIKHLVIGHFPSSDQKGTDEIVKAMQSFKDSYNFEFVYSLEKVSHKENLKRINECDIIIDLMKTTQWGKPYGQWGVVSLEAAAMGKVVWASNVHQQIYESFYGVCPIDTIHKQDDIKRLLSYYTEIRRETFHRHQIIMYNWIKDNHSFQASGNYFKKFI